MISARLRREVIERAAERCEYCGLAQAGQEGTFHIDHVMPRADGGPTVLGNLALACISCSLRKGASSHSIDPESGVEAPIFNPRTQKWSDHFRWNDVEMIGLTPIGRATISKLRLNREVALAIRGEEKFRHRHPPVRPV